MVSIADERYAKGPRSPERFVLVRGDLPGGRLQAASVGPVLDALRCAPGADGSFWLDIEAIAAEEMEELRACLGLHATTARDCLFEDSQVSDEKWEHFPGRYLFVIADRLAVDPTHRGRWRTENVNVIVLAGGRGCVTLRNSPLPELATLAAAAAAGRAADSVLVDVLSVVVGALVPLVSAAADAADALDLAVLASADAASADEIGAGAVLRDVAELRGRLAKLRGSLASKREVLARLCDAELPLAEVGAPAARALRALFDTVTWKLARVEDARETVTGASATHLALVSLRVGAAAHETNRVIRNLSLLLAITTPLTLLASVFGMNVRLSGA